MTETQDTDLGSEPGAELELVGRLLIAMPGMADPRFAHSVVFVCAHSEDGTMGLIVNKPVEGLKLSHLLKQLSITLERTEYDDDLFFGGPVENRRGFVLHSAEYQSDLASLKVDPVFSMTATQDVLEDMARGKGPAQALVALGYSGWGPGQLAREIGENGWLICDATLALVFEVASVDKWSEALKSIGVDALSLSATAGHA